MKSSICLTRFLGAPSRMVGANRVNRLVSLNQFRLSEGGQTTRTTVSVPRRRFVRCAWTAQTASVWRLLPRPMSSARRNEFMFHIRAIPLFWCSKNRMPGSRISGILSSSGLVTTMCYPFCDPFQAGVSPASRQGNNSAPGPLWTGGTVVFAGTRHPPCPPESMVAGALCPGKSGGCREFLWRPPGRGCSARRQPAHGALPGCWLSWLSGPLISLNHHSSPFEFIGYPLPCGLRGAP